MQREASSTVVSEVDNETRKVGTEDEDPEPDAPPSREALVVHYLLKISQLNDRYPEYYTSVPRDSPLEEVQRAYVRMARRIHVQQEQDLLRECLMVGMAALESMRRGALLS